MSIETQDQFALHQARQQQLIRSSKYIKDFLGQSDQILDYEQSPCPTCGQDANRVLFSKNNGHYSYCPGCKHIYLLNPLKEEKLIKFYTGYPTSSLEWHRSESDFYRRIYQKGLEMIKPLSKGVDMLDIGCSSGYFLSIASEHGFSSNGIEPNAQESDYASNNGINILGSTISDLDECKKFDVITLWDVLEHIRQPVNYLQRLQRHLALNGLIFVQVPSSDSLAARIMRGACNMFDGIEHLTLFSARSLDIAFQNAGYRRIASQSVISELHALQNYLDYQNDPYLGNSDNPFCAKILSAELIESSGLGYKLQALYRAEQ
jgi:SAM-dependent methyltransferase